MEFFCDAYKSRGAAKRLSSGFLRAPVTIGKSGVLVYRDANGNALRVLREPVELEASLDAAQMLPVTHGHPGQEYLPLTPKTVKKVQVGQLGDTVRWTGHTLEAQILLTDADAIAAVEAGKTQVSPGYYCELERTPGVWNGIAYDAVQRGITYDHIAIVAQGRAGPDVAIHLDATDRGFWLDEETMDENTTQVEATEQTVVEPIVEAQPVQDAASEAVPAVDEKQLLIDELQTKLAAVPAQIADAVKAAVKARVALERQAEKVLGELQLDGLSDLEIRRAVATKRFPELADRISVGDEAYVTPLCDAALLAPAAVSSAAVPHPGLSAQRTVISTERSQSPADVARQRLLERGRSLAPITTPGFERG